MTCKGRAYFRCNSSWGVTSQVRICRHGHGLDQSMGWVGLVEDFHT